jgi:hypothetical protein
MSLERFLRRKFFFCFLRLRSSCTHAAALSIAPWIEPGAFVLVASPQKKMCPFTVCS